MNWFAKIFILTVGILLLSSCNLTEEGNGDSENTPDAPDIYEDFCTVTFDTMGVDIDVDPITVKRDEKITKPDLSTCTYTDSEGNSYNLILSDWYVGEMAWNFDKNIVLYDITLRAKWSFEDDFFDPKENAEVRAENTKMRMMSFNVLSYKYNNKPPVNQRKSNVIDSILRYMPDVVALQECDEKWYEALNSGLTGYKFVNYDTEGANKVNGSVNFSTIMYNSEALELLELEQKRLKTSDNKNGRIVTVALFENKESGEKFICMSTHWCLKEEMRIENAAETAAIVFECKEKYPDIPIIVAGDFNANDSESSISEFTAQSGMVDSKNAESTGIVCSTYHLGNGMRVEDKNVNNPVHWLRGPESFLLSNITTTESIDHIFVDASVTSLYYSTVVDRDALNGSDHCPIYCDLTW